MTIGRRLRRAMDARDLTQKEIAVRTGLEPATVSDIVNDRTKPKHETVERMVEAIGVTFGELYDEPRLYLSERDVETLKRAADLNQRLVENDAAQKALRDLTPPPPRPPRRGGDVIHDARRHPADELVSLINFKIPQAFGRENARQAFRVITDSMIGAGIQENDIVYVRWSPYEEAADGEIIVCRLNGALKIKRLDLRGGRRVLQNANPRYEDLVIGETDTFNMIGVVVTAGK